jgi:signal transduction histidine kinase
MRLSIKAKQVAGVTAIVALTVLVLSGWFLASLARVLIEESATEAHLLADTIALRASEVVSTLDPTDDLYKALRDDAGLGSILRAALGSHTAVYYAAIVDLHDGIIVHTDPEPANIGKPLRTVSRTAGNLDDLLTKGVVAQVRALYAKEGFIYDVRVKLVPHEADVSVGVSTLAMRGSFTEAIRTPMYTTIAAISGAILVALLLAQLVLRPIHVIRSGLARLGRGELNVNVDLPEDGDLGDIGDSFKAVSARLEADRTQLAGQQATIESVVKHLEDAVALVSPDGTILFANPAMRSVLGEAAQTITAVEPATHPYRVIIEQTLADRQSRGPLQVSVPGLGDRLAMTHTVEGAEHEPLGVLLVARNLAYLSQVESTLSYSRKLAALGKLSAGIAHEIKNPLNAMMIHLELLKMDVAEAPAGREHVAVIAAQLRRLDEVVQGFLRFTRPEELRLQPVPVAEMIEAILPVVRAEAERHRIDVRVDVPADLPPVSADRVLLQQAFLNLALNACQAMPSGGRLRIAANTRGRGRVEVVFEDSGVGIPPEQLGRIFDLYFTTKDQGSGIGLSMVYRTVQLHDGDIEVQSVPGRGTTFRVTLRQAKDGTGTAA